MKYPSIHIEGAILSPDILERIEDLPGQKPSDFGFDSGAKVKDEIARAWADAQDYWRIFQRKLETLKVDSPATTETRQQWVVPFLGLLGYQLDFQARGTELNGKLYSISHRASNRAQAPVQIVGYREPAGLDRKPERTNVRMSAHAVVQEFINLNEQLYGIVTNGRILRLLRDSSRLIKLSYLEFDLDRIFNDGLFSDFAILFRILHASRLPITNDAAAESLIERYHQDSLDSGARIREGLSQAVEQAIRDFGNGFLSHPANEELRNMVIEGRLKPTSYYKNLLRLIYRLLFLMVIEERDLVFPSNISSVQRDIYHRYYSVQRLRQLSERRYLADHRRHDLWLSLKTTFRLFENERYGSKLGIAPLAGELFGNQAIRHLADCFLGNDVLLNCLRSLSLYEHPENHQLVRVNYAALNVEEFGSVYEGLLEYEPVFNIDGAHVEFGFKAGDERATTGSHYTPDDLVQPLIKHSLDYLIEERLKDIKPESALLELRVADISCGSGHILLAAARRIANALAIVRTGEEQPSPSAFRTALRDVIRTCIYGVDINPLAVELCKVALWLEAHNPGQPLNFLDHHIKCGNAIVGFARREEVERGVPDQSFTSMPGDEKEIVSKWRTRNKSERKEYETGQLPLAPAMKQHFDAIHEQWLKLSLLPERTPIEIEEKKTRYIAFAEGPDAGLLNQIAAIPIAQFYIPKTTENDRRIITDAEFRGYWNALQVPRGLAPAMASAIANEKRFFHWFLEFPDVIEKGGFDCILGNPPYLMNRKISGRLGDAFLNWVKFEYAPAGAVDLVTYFVRRIFNLLKPSGFMALISTNTISQGAAREGGLDVIIDQGGRINFAIRSKPWPGLAAVSISLLSIHKGEWNKSCLLDEKLVEKITPYLDSQGSFDNPVALTENIDKSFQGSIVLGTGFIIEPSVAKTLIDNSPRLTDVLFPYLNGSDLNSNPQQLASRWVINFFDWAEDKCKSEYPEAYAIVEAKVKPERTRKNEQGGFVLRKPLPDRWWIYADKRPKLYSLIRDLYRVLVIAQVSRTVAFAFVSPKQVLDAKLVVFPFEDARFFAILQSSFHYHWAWRYCTTMKTDLSYTPSAIFLTFPFPEMNKEAIHSLDRIGEHYLEHRNLVMKTLWLGLTDINNLFNAHNLTPETVAKVSKKSVDVANQGYQGILELRLLHRQLDNVVRDAYGWKDIDLGHDFHEVVTLPENDRVRYTISPAAHKEVLCRLLALNHARAEEKSAVKAQSKRKKKFIEGVYSIPFQNPLAPSPVQIGLTAQASAVLPNLANLDSNAWATPPNVRPENVALFALIDVLRNIGHSVDSQFVRVAAILVRHPALALAFMSDSVGREWVRVVGTEATPLPATIVQISQYQQNAIDYPWAEAVQQLEATQGLITASGKWSAGTQLPLSSGQDWVSGRVAITVPLLSQIDLTQTEQKLIAFKRSIKDGTAKRFVS